MRVPEWLALLSAIVVAVLMVAVVDVAIIAYGNTLQTPAPAAPPSPAAAP
jgi:hypothetical protein